MPTQTEYPDLPAAATEPTPAEAQPDALALFRKLREVHAGTKPSYNKAAWAACEAAMVEAISRRVDVTTAPPGYFVESLIARVKSLAVNVEQGMNYSNGMYAMRRMVLVELTKMLPTEANGEIHK
jgi:hypothetical protein